MSELFPVVSSVKLIEKCLSLAQDDRDHEAIQMIETVNQINHTIGAFNLGVQAMFKIGSAESVLEFCTPKWAEAMAGKYSTWRSEGIRELNLVACRFLASDLQASDQAIAFSFEHWNFLYESGESRVTSGAVDGYTLLKGANKWLIDKVDFYHRD